MSKYLDGVILTTGEEVPEPLVYRTYKILGTFSPFLLDQLRKLCLNPNYQVGPTHLRELKKAEIVDSQGNVYNGIREIALACIKGTGLDSKVVSPVSFPLMELVTRNVE